MPDYPFHPASSPCELELDLLILQEMERESWEFFSAMRVELQFYLKRTRQLEKLLADNGIPLPEYKD